MNLYHDRPGALSDDQVADALVVAQYAGISVMRRQANVAADVAAGHLSLG